ncbi:hypothetical protein LEP1GSC170_1646 [Leptospira interrogans serovar Bataviae str. HAI135]|nr:hypothetical protein LEP1GSC170_1646 [Leptospira interrogans serovar Bataviae str. HAI135]
MEFYEFGQDENREFLRLSRVLKLASFSFLVFPEWLFSAFVSIETGKLVLFLVPAILFYWLGFGVIVLGFLFKELQIQKERIWIFYKLVFVV